MIHGFGFENMIYHLLSNLYDSYKMTDIGGQHITVCLVLGSSTFECDVWSWVVGH